MKIKSHSGMKKRIKFSSTGKAKAEKIAKRHLLSQKSKKAKGRNKYGFILDSTMKKQLKRSLPYGK